MDGGLLSNFPVWLFDVEGTPPWPTIGFKLVDPDYCRPHDVRGPLAYASALVSTMLEAHDARYLEAADAVRTIFIPTMGVRTTDFNLSPEQRHELYQAGVQPPGAFSPNGTFIATCVDIASARRSDATNGVHAMAEEKWIFVNGGGPMPSGASSRWKTEDSSWATAFTK